MLQISSGYFAYFFRCHSLSGYQDTFLMLKLRHFILLLTFALSERERKWAYSLTAAWNSHRYERTCTRILHPLWGLWSVCFFITLYIKTHVSSSFEKTLKEAALEFVCAFVQHVCVLCAVCMMEALDKGEGVK